MQVIQRRMAPAVAAAVVAAAIGVDVLLSACGSPTGPSPTRRFTVTITASGVTPAVLDTGLGCVGCVAVTFINQDTAPHDVRSDPHPEHTGCQALNVGVIPPGQSKESSALTECADLVTSSWRYHDDTRPDDPRFTGLID